MEKHYIVKHVHQTTMMFLLRDVITAMNLYVLHVIRVIIVKCVMMKKNLRMMKNIESK